MRDVVRAAFWPWLGHFEGLYLEDGTMFRWLGLDVKGRPVTALGCDLPSPAAMAELTWTPGEDANLPPATYDVVCHEWARVAAMRGHAGEGAASAVFRDSAHLYVTPVSLYAWCDRKANRIEAALRLRIPRWDNVEAGAQMARLRTAWADGPESPWPRLDAAIEAGDWSACALECVPRDLHSQPAAYSDSYSACQALYLACAFLRPDELPSPLPIR